ncbi:MAG: hypothetical protein Q4G68_04405 [Planctomycetia bacterium]|nr:hypothetical protein [Planctomycetia bacterium]
MKRNRKSKLPVEPAAWSLNYDQNQANTNFPGRRITSVLLFYALGFFLLYFVTREFSVGLPIRRFFLCLMPIIDPQLIGSLWTENEPVALLDRLPWFASAAALLITIWSVGTVVCDRIRMPYDYGIGLRFFFAMVCGASLCSALIALMALCGCLTAPLWIMTAFGLLGACAYGVRKLRTASDVHKMLHRSPGSWIFLTLALLLTFLYLAGSAIPTSEYDMLEYHLQGAREIYERGHLAFAPHNVYLNMPLGVEMFYLWGMVMTGSVFYGALVGKIVVASFALTTAIGIGAFVYHVLKKVAPAAASAAIYLAFPANYLVFSTGLNDGVCGFAILAIVIISMQILKNRCTYGMMVLAGLALAFAISVKYTMVVFVGIPFALLLVFASVREKRWRPAVLCCVITLLAGGLWYGKNLIATGNPVYPLAYTIFGDSSGTWTPELNQRWTKAHGPSSFSPATAMEKGTEILVNSRDAAPFAAMAILSFLFVCMLGAIRRNSLTSVSVGSIIFFLAGYLTLFVLIWFFATHQQARFLVPVIPVTVLLLVCSLDVCFDGLPSYLYNRTLFLLATAVCVSLGMCAILQSGYLAPLEHMRRDPERYGNWSVWFSQNSDILNEKSEPDKESSLLLVAEANAFAYQLPIQYSTCWNESPLAQCLHGAVVYDKSGTHIVSIFDPAAISNRLKERGVRFILFNQAEWRRFTSFGNYGFTSTEIEPALFDLLVQAGVLKFYFPENYDSFTEYSRTAFDVYEVD